MHQHHLEDLIIPVPLSLPPSFWSGTARPHLRINISTSSSVMLALLVPGLTFCEPHCFRVNSKWIKSALKVKKEKENWNLHILTPFIFQILEYLCVGGSFVCVCVCEYWGVYLSFSVLSLGKRNRFFFHVFTSGYANDTKLFFATENNC